MLARKWLSARPPSGCEMVTEVIMPCQPIPVAERELRLFGKYRVLFNLDEQAEEVTIILVGEKRGNSLIVQGEEFTGHESDTAE